MVSMLMMWPDLIRILHAHDNCPNELFNICLCAAAVIVGDNGQCVPTVSSVDIGWRMEF